MLVVKRGASSSSELTSLFTQFALFFGNRGFFPASLQRTAREELPQILKQLGHETLMMDAEATRYGAIETPAEGEMYRKFLETHRGEFDLYLWSLPVSSDFFYQRNVRFVLKSRLYFSH